MTMSAQICTHCYEALSTLIATSEDTDRQTTVLYPQTCYLCANLHESIRNAWNRDLSETIQFSKRATPQPGHFEITVTCVRGCQGTYDEFLAVPAPGNTAITLVIMFNIR